MDENTTLNFTVVMSDSKDLTSAADSLEAMNVYGPFNGVIGGDSLTGFLTYTPKKDFVGTDVVFLAAKEIDTPEELSSLPLLMVTIVVKNINAPPYAFDREIFLKEDHTRVFRLFAFDKEDDIRELTYQVLSSDPPQHAIGDTVNINGNVVTYVPDTNYNNGLNVADSFKYVVTDTDGGMDTAMVRITIFPVIRAILNT